MAAITDTTTLARPARSLRSTTLVTGVAAAVITTAAAGLADVAGVSYQIDGEVIPLLGFTQMTFLGAVLGGLILAGLNRWSGAARRRFLEITVVLTALTCIPSIAMPDDVASKVVLVGLHLLAAAIVVPVLVRHARS